MTDSDDDLLTRGQQLLTVAQAAERLGITERLARRYPAKLADSDRTVSETGVAVVRAFERIIQEQARGSGSCRRLLSMSANSRNG